MVNHVVLWLVLAGASSAAQQSGNPLDFDVASVKRSDVRPGTPTPSAPGVASPGGRWSATNATLSQMLQALYDLRPEQITGAPSWVNSDMFVIAARAGTASATRPQMNEMAKRLLADRFSLRFHLDQQSFKVHAMQLARRDGALGPGLRPTTCETERRPCGTLRREVVDGLQRIHHNGFALRTLLNLHRVEALLGTRVVDETGLNGTFDVDLEFAPDPILWPSTAGAGAPVGPPLINAFETQLGLKFERREQTLDRFVIDAVSAPSPD